MTMGLSQYFLLVILFCSNNWVLSDDKTCAARDVGTDGSSMVCVCNSTYCDTVTREAPKVGAYVIYTSSKSGKRFEKSFGTIQSYSSVFEAESEQCDVDDGTTMYGNSKDGSGEDSDDDQSCKETFWNSASMSLQVENRQQYVEGFGGSITDAVAYNWYKLSEEMRSQLISTYFGEDGLGYSMIRIPIGGSDFSDRPYTYNDYPLNDETLFNFTLAEEDTKMKIPMIKAIQKVSKKEIKIIASTWSPPVWMKTNEKFYGYAQLKQQYYQSYADYHLRFIEEYEKRDIKIWAVTTTNRPTNGIMPEKNINSLGWYPADLGRWLAINLGPTIRRSRFNKTLIFAVDDERHLLDWYLHGMQRADKNVMKYIDGIAVHYYSSSSSPSLILDQLKQKYKKLILGTQACEGATGWDSTRIKIGSWDRAARYIQNIIEDLNHHSVGWMDFNLCLDVNGGPNWAKNYVDAPILVYHDKNEFVKQPMFYAMGHFTRLIPKGSQRIVMATQSITEIHNVAFVSPEGNILMVLYNSKTVSVKVHIRINSKRYIEVTIEAEAIKTIEINPNESVICKQESSVAYSVDTACAIDYYLGNVQINFMMSTLTNAGLFLNLILLGLVAFTRSDQPCAARDLGIEGRSIVCVCNSTYCDTISRDPPAPNTFVAYTSSRAGKRFEKETGRVLTFSSYNDAAKYDTEKDFTKHRVNQGQEKQNNDDGQFWTRATLVLDQNVRFQTIEGFGGSVTDAAAYNWIKLSDETKEFFIRSYYGEEGLEYNLIRTPIGGADFSTHPYTYNEYPWNDAALTNFTFTNEDIFLKIPMIKHIQRTSKQEVKLMASTWSPPVWMKTNERITGFAQLKPEYFQSYADYHIKFMELYEQAEIEIWALTTTNEPINGIVPFVTFNSIGWFPAELGRWVGQNLGPTLRSSRFNKTLIFAVDDQRYLLHLYLLGMEAADRDSIKYTDGIAVHYYGNFAPPLLLDDLHTRYNKVIIATEACEGPMPWDIMRVKIGSWERAYRYTKNIMEDLNHYVAGWIDWNLCLDEKGGPNWANNFVDAPILVYPERDEFIKQPMFYAMGHFSKFIPRGSRRISSTYPFLDLGRIPNIAFITPGGNIVVVLQNTNTFNMDVRINIDALRHVQVTVESESIKTIEINPRLFK
ncbi:unnamed protein product [Leptosia nina]|uniref:Glucosylceramidase n=1 Tax=Leptosia nina TaxID=320188 RepID=A0AAV1JR61_9NEOP